ncbi:MAG: transcriptional repressor [Planctomycetes bacterium]|nr:transcriptional repressor [Planctomycetota bacterium]
MPRAVKAVATELLGKFDSYLQRKSLKLTAQRRRIVEQILGMDKTHFAADDLVDEFRDQKPRVSKATVYRALGVLVEAGILEQHDFGESHKVFELSEGRDHHDHCMCTRCGKIIEFHSDEMEALQERVAAGLGFHPTHHSQKIFGICKDCWKQGQR